MRRLTLRPDYRRDAAPLTYVMADDPPFLRIHGDAGKTVPYNQSESMEAALKYAGVTVKLVRVSGGDHGSDFPGNTQKMDWRTVQGLVYAGRFQCVSCCL